LACIAADSPRLMKSHLPIELMPDRWPGHGKVVHLTRIPKDVCVSYFHEARDKALRHQEAYSKHRQFADSRAIY
jgi:hypothetical protein